MLGFVVKWQASIKMPSFYELSKIYLSLSRPIYLLAQQESNLYAELQLKMNTLSHISKIISCSLNEVSAIVCSARGHSVLPCVHSVLLQLTGFSLHCRILELGCVLRTRTPPEIQEGKMPDFCDFL